MGYETGDSLFFIAQAYRGLGDESQALAKFEEAIKTQTDHFHSMANIGRIYLKKSEFAQAAKWAKRSLKIAPGYILPIAILMIISLVEKTDESLRMLIERVEDERRKLLRTEVERGVASLGLKGYKGRLNSAFKAAKSVPMKPTRRRAPNRPPKKRLQPPRQ